MKQFSFDIPEFSKSLMLVNGNAISIPLADESVHCVIASPPYWGLRDYGTARWEGGDPECDHIALKKANLKSGLRNDGRKHKGLYESEKAVEIVQQYRDICGKCGAIRVDNQLGLEKTVEEYVANMVAVFREIKRVLRDDGTCWLNLGSSYLPNKQMAAIPWKVGLALQDDGWYLRQDIIWAKGNPMPESVTDRCCKSHEYVLLLAKNEKYFFDHYAIQERAANEGVRSLQKRTANNGVLQKQPAERWTDEEMPRLYNDSQKEVRQEVQPKREGTPERETILLFREGTDSEKVVSSILPDDRGTARTLQGVEEDKGQERSTLQSEDGKILAISERESEEGGERQALSTNGGREILETQGCSQTQLSDQDNRLHPNKRTVEEDQREIQERLRILREGVDSSGDGSHNSIIEGREAYSGKRSSSMSDLQLKEGEQDIAKRNARSVWFVNTQPYKGSHYATFPEALIEPMVKAGTSERGVCPKCAAPWKRVVEKQGTNKSDEAGIAAMIAKGVPRQKANLYVTHDRGTSQTVGWKPTCDCGIAETVPAIVFDPFAGSGTTLLVARKFGRKGVGLDLSMTYLKDNAQKRLK